MKLVISILLIGSLWCGSDAQAAPIVITIAQGTTPGSWLVTLPGSATPVPCSSLSAVASQLSTASGSFSSGQSATINFADSTGTVVKTAEVTYNGVGHESEFGSAGSSAADSFSKSSTSNSASDSHSSSDSSSDSSSSGSRGSGGSGSGEGKDGKGRGGKGNNGNHFGQLKGCFHGDTTVMTNKGEMKMAEMYAADQSDLTVRTADGQFSPVAFWLHAEPQRPAEFIRLTTATGQQLSLTPGHLVFKTQCDRLRRQSTRADKVAVGDCLMVDSDGHLQTAEVSAVDKFQSAGIFSPVTASGDLLVDNILASCYSEVESTRLQSVMFDYLNAVKSAAQLLLPSSLHQVVFGGADGANLAEVVTNFLSLNDKFTA